ncbi:MAG: GGDEF domain-containing protein [Planctomycetota bacterium]|jgi:diguanylate cyclase (GGDEF)-like protein|nr:GGDEF domain-containing protein [Planctomycetota bacterium]
MTEQPETTGDAENPERELRYLRDLVERDAAKLLALDAKIIAIRHELEQKRRGFSLMAELAVTLGGDADYEDAFISVSKRLNATLNMQRTAVLVPDEDGRFRARVLQGYSAGEREPVAARAISVDRELLDPLKPVIVTGADPASRLESFRQALMLPYLISSPVMLKNRMSALLVTGRLIEQRPYFPRLGVSDAESVQTVGAYLAALLTGFQLRQAESMAKHDPLTELPNRRGSTEQLQHALAVARRGGFFFAAMFVDLDGFKQVNDTLGHAAGDVVLRAVADRFSSCMRESDFVGRIGGDEFIVVLSHIKRPEDAGVVAQKLIAKLNEPIIVGDGSAKVSASIGIAIFPDNGSTTGDLIKAADEAMYAVKNKGKCSFAFAPK